MMKISQQKHRSIEKYIGNILLCLYGQMYV